MTKQKRQPAPRVSRPAFWESWSPRTQDILIIAMLYVITLLLFREIVFDRAAFASAGDTQAATSYGRAGNLIAERENVDVLWMPFFFSGMPTFGNVAYIPHDVNYLQKVLANALDLLYLKGPWTWLVVFYFLSGVFMYIMMRGLSFKRLPSLFAALGYMLSPYAIGLASEGHGSKLMALSYLPMAFLAIHMLFERRSALWLGVSAASLGTVMLTNHVQIVYYTLMVVGLYLLYRIAVEVRTSPAASLKNFSLFLVAVVLAFGIASYIYLSVYEYSQYSIRGGGTTGATGGLTWEYATNWSWHPSELLTLFIPGFFGFQMPYYWGSIEPWTNSTVYVGLLPVALAVVAVLYRRTSTTWFFLILTLLVILASFGRTFPLLYQLMFSLLPFFDKFRAPAMILHLIAFTLPVLGAAGLSAIVESRDQADAGRQEKTLKALRITIAVALGLLVLFALAKSTLFDMLSGSMFMKEGELGRLRQQYGEQAPQAIAHFRNMRFEIFYKDMVKFLVLASISIGLALAFFRHKLQAATFSALVVLLLVVDLIIVDEKLIDPKPNREIEQAFAPDATVTFLAAQPGAFRIFPAGEMFMDISYAPHGLESIGGYSPAKLKIYQTMLDSCLYRGPDPSLPLNMNILNMLGVRYLLVSSPLPPDLFPLAHADPARKIYTYTNPRALPLAFLVDSVVVAPSDGQTFRILNSATFNPRTTAVLEKPLSSPVTVPDSGATVTITERQSRRIELATSSNAPALLVLSEIYYPAGWTATIDGTETEILRTNYVLRSVAVPAGRHSVVFSFDPQVYHLGWITTHISWAITLLLVIVGALRLPRVRHLLARRTAASTGSS